MGRPKKDEKIHFSEREIKLAEMRNGRIEKKYLLELVMDYKWKKKLNPKYSMPRDLAEIVIIIVAMAITTSLFRVFRLRESFHKLNCSSCLSTYCLICSGFGISSTILPFLIIGLSIGSVISPHTAQFEA